MSLINPWPTPGENYYFLWTSYISMNWKVRYIAAFWFIKRTLNEQSRFCSNKSWYLIIANLILIHEYQHKSTQVNTDQHESTRVNTNQHESNTSPTRVNTSQHDFDTSQQKPTWVRHESTWTNASLTRVNTSPKQVLNKILLKI